MGYAIKNCSGSSREIEELAAFLSDFIRSGEGAAKDLAGREAETWRSRLDWWWSTNPFCREDSPKGLILRRSDRSVGGFFGFIPHDYVAGGEIVPSLISTTTFVCGDCREAAMGLFLRAHRLREDFQIVDGGPNEDVRVLLERTGYQGAGDARLFFYPVSIRSWDLPSLVLQGARFFTPRANGALAGGSIVTELDEVRSVPSIADPRLRKQVDRGVLEWYLGSGTRPKTFLGWCDEDGCLRCYLIGSVKKKRGVSLLVLTDAAAFDRDSEALLGELVAHAAAAPAAAKIPDEVRMLAWPSRRPPDRRRSPFSIRYDANVFYHLPSRLGGTERLTIPFEGDHDLL